MDGTHSTSLSKKIGLYAIGKFGSKILTFLLVPLYSYYLNKEEFGYYDLVITGINLIVPFVTLQVSDSVFRWLITSTSSSQRSKAIANAFFVILLGFGVILLTSCSVFLIRPIKGQLLITIISLLSVWYPFIQQVARGLGQTKLFALNGLLFTVVYLVSNLVLLIYYKKGIDALFYSLVIGYSISSFSLLFKLKFWKYLKLRLVSFKEIKEMLVYSIPLVPNTISWWLINSANKYIILLFLGVAGNGLYAMSNRFPVILVLVNQIFTLAWQESAILNIHNSKDTSEYERVLEKLIKVQFSLVIILTLVSQFVISILINEEFLSSWLYMPILYLSVAFLSLSGFYGALYLGVKKTKEIFTTTIYGGVTNIILAFLLVPLIGLYGAAIATAVGYAALLFIRVFSTKKFVAIKFPTLKFFLYVLLTAVAFLIAYQENIILSSCTLVILLGFLLFDNRNDLKLIRMYIAEKIK